MEPLEDGRVIVIGGGLAGLTTAYRLSQSGVDVVVLESRERVGGRASTNAQGWADGQYADHGGELVDVSYHGFIALAKELGVELSEPVHYTKPDVEDRTAVEGYLRQGRFILGGRVASDEETEAAIASLRQAVDEHPPEPHEIVEQWIRRSRLDGLAALAVRAVARMFDLHDPWDSDMHFVLNAKSRGFRRVLGGTQALAVALAERLDVRVNTSVTKVERTGGVVVHTESGEVFTGTRVVCATNMYRLITMGFDPPLPDSKIMAIQSLLPAMGGKVIAQYADGDSVREALSHLAYGDGAFNAVWAASPHISSGPAVVVGFLSGVNRHLLTDVTSALDELDAFVSIATGHEMTRLHGEVKSWWQDDDYVTITVTPPELMRAGLAALLGAVEQRTHVAGDFTDAGLCGTLEGAIRSGNRVADEILRHPTRFDLSKIEKRLVRS